MNAREDDEYAEGLDISTRSPKRPWLMFWCYLHLWNGLQPGWSWAKHKMKQFEHEQNRGYMWEG